MFMSDIAKYDPALRTAMKVGEQAGLPKGVMESWYGQVLLGEMQVGEFVKLIEGNIRWSEKPQPGLLAIMDGVKKSLPLL